MFKEFDITRIKMKQIENAKTMVRKRFPELVLGYLRDAEIYLAKIAEGLSEQDYEVIVRNSHALKSSSASLGTTGVFEIARELEKVAKEPETHGLEEMQYLADLLNEAVSFATPKLKDLLDNAA
ncbi:MAG: Hpt domain-containing protein [Methyloligellaceae bacterium]